MGRFMNGKQMNGKCDLCGAVGPWTDEEGLLPNFCSCDEESTIPRLLGRSSMSICQECMRLVGEVMDEYDDARCKVEKVLDERSKLKQARFVGTKP